MNHQVPGIKKRCIQVTDLTLLGVSTEGQPLVVRYRHDRYIHIDFDSRVGRVKVCETEKNGGDGNGKRSF